MPILFSDFLKQKLHPVRLKGGTYWDAFSTLVAAYDGSLPNWVVVNTLKQVRRLRQLDKFEPAITYYTFAALAEATGNLSDANALTDLLTQAFSAEAARSLAQRVVDYQARSLKFEGQLAPNKTLREKVKEAIAACPVAYHRDIHAGRKRVRYESATRLDCFIGDNVALGKDSRRSPGQFGLGIEAKFTSDIDNDTTYSPHRNQIARILEIGNQRCEQFFFLLVAPRCYRLLHSRLYVYKMQEYLSSAGVAALRRDILLPQSDETLARWLRHVGWLDWEHIVEFLYPDGRPRVGWNSTDSAAFQNFLKERRLWPRT
jgi:hypothetical protein